MSLNPRIESFKGQVVWLVGASTGIGRATALALAREGAQVWVSARGAANLAAVVLECKSAGGTAHALVLDVTDSNAAQAAAQHILAQAGRLDVVMFCAGTYAAMRAQQWLLSGMLHHNHVNYIGALHLIDAVLEPMRAQVRQGQPAHLSLVSSVAGFRGLPKSLAYGPTKAALTNLAEALYIDLHEEGMGISVVHPGFVETPLTAQNNFHMPGLMTPEAAAQEILRGWRKGEFDIHFPKGFTRWMKTLRLLPHRAYFAATRRFTGL